MAFVGVFLKEDDDAARGEVADFAGDEPVTDRVLIGETEGTAGVDSGPLVIVE
jgi:hypothetical protein